MNGIKGLTLLALALSGLMVLAGCSGSGRIEDDDKDENDQPASGTVEGGGRGGASPGPELILLVGGLGVAGAWTAHRVGRKK